MCAQDLHTCQDIQGGPALVIAISSEEYGRFCANDLFREEIERDRKILYAKASSAFYGRNENSLNARSKVF